MTKQELIDVLKYETSLTKHETKRAVELFFDEMSNALANGNRVEIRGLCSFHIKKYRPYTGRNPKTGKKVKVKTKKLPYFKAGKELRDRVDK